MVTENLLILFLYLFSPLNFSIIGFIALTKTNDLRENPQVLLIIFGYLSTMIIAVFRNQRVLFLASFFTAILAGYGFYYTVNGIREYTSN